MELEIASRISRSFGSLRAALEKGVVVTWKSPLSFGAETWKTHQKLCRSRLEDNVLKWEKKDYASKHLKTKSMMENKGGKLDARLSESGQHHPNMDHGKCKGPSIRNQPT